MTKLPQMTVPNVFLGILVQVHCRLNIYTHATSQYPGAPLLQVIHHFSKLLYVISVLGTVLLQFVCAQCYLLLGILLQYQYMFYAHQSALLKASWLSFTLMPLICTIITELSFDPLYAKYS